MKTYLQFSVDGEILELKTNDKIFNKDNYTDYNNIENVIYNKHNFILLFNNKELEKKNISVLPFYKNDIYGNFLLFIIDNDKNIKSLTEHKYLKLLSIAKKNYEEYSSDDFNLSDD